MTMLSTEPATENAEKLAKPGLLRRFGRSREGATAVEFAFLAMPFFLIVFAIFETFIAFTAEQLLGNAVDTMARKIRTGQITYGLGRSTDMTETQFRTAFCAEISAMITCSSSELTTPAKLYLDVRTFTTFANMPTTVPRVGNTTFGDLDTTGFAYTPGGASKINMVRAFYRWQIITDIMRPYLTNIRPADGSTPSDYLMVATAAFQNEAYP